MRIRVTDLFAGAGGLTQGLVTADTAFLPFQAVEMDVDAGLSYGKNFPTSEVFIESIVDWLEDDRVRETDVVIGGPPCQGFSRLGKQEENDEKNFLWEQYAEVVHRANPRYFVMENVPEFAKSQQRDVFLSELDHGALSEYEARISQVNAADYGAPQSRRRMIILGWRKDVPVLRLPEPSHSPANYLTVRDAFNGLASTVRTTKLPSRQVDYHGRYRPGPFRTDELHITRNFQEISLQRFAAIPPGGNRFNLPEDLKAPCWKKHTSGSGDVMGRLFWNKPSVTIRTEFNKPEKGRYLHPEENRAITHHEAARLMGFPDDYQWVGSKTAIARQIGNAVPIALGEAIGRNIAQLFYEVEEQ